MAALPPRAEAQSPCVSSLRSSQPGSRYAYRERGEPGTPEYRCEGTVRREVSDHDVSVLAFTSARFEVNTTSRVPLALRCAGRAAGFAQIRGADIERRVNYRLDARPASGAVHVPMDVMRGLELEGEQLGFYCLASGHSVSDAPALRSANVFFPVDASQGAGLAAGGDGPLTLTFSVRYHDVERVTATVYPVNSEGERGRPTYALNGPPLGRRYYAPGAPLALELPPSALPTPGLYQIRFELRREGITRPSYAERYIAR